MARSITIPNITMRQPEVILTEQLSMLIAPFRLTENGVKKSDLRVPISPVQDPDGTEVFEDPNGGQKYYLPHYTLAEHLVGGQQQYRIAFRHDKPRDRWGLHLTLAKNPPAPLAAAAAQMRPLPHEIRASLSFAAGASRREMVLELERDAGSELDLVLWCASIAERDLLYQAIKSPDAEPRMTVMRQIEVAVEASGTGPLLLENGGRSAQLRAMRGLAAGALRDADISRAALTPARAELFRGHSALVTGNLAGILSGGAQPNGDAMPRPEVRQTDFRWVQFGTTRAAEVELTITNIMRFGRALFRQMPGTGKQPARLEIEITDARTGQTYLRDGMRGTGAPYNPRILRFFGGEDSLPDAVIITMRDAKRDRIVRSGKIGITAGPQAEEELYSVVEIDLPLTVSPTPFTFDETLHSYLYDALSALPPVPVRGGLARHRESHKDRVHSYFQDMVTPNRIYFLPDSFKIARHDRAFRSPKVTVRVATDDDDGTIVTMDYVIAPVVDEERLGTAAMAIAEKLGLAASDLEFQPFLTEDLSYTLSRPTTSGRRSEDRPVSPLMLQEPMVDTLVLTQEDFQITFDAMVGETASTITGEVLIAVEEWGEESCGVRLDFRDLAGQAYTVDQVIMNRGNDNAAVVFLTNATESGLGAEGLRIAADRDGMRQPIDGPLDGLPADHVVLPGQDIDPEIAFDDLPGSGPVEITVLEPGLARPDPEAILAAIIDPSALQYHRTISIQTFSNLFPDPSATEDPNDLLGILVEFDTGQAILLDADTDQAEVRIEFPFADVILGRAVGDGGYRYRKTVFRRGGQESDAEFIADTKDLLVVLPNVSPAVA